MMAYIQNASYRQGMEYLEMVLEVLNNENDTFGRNKDSLLIRRKEVLDCMNYLRDKYKNNKETIIDDIIIPEEIKEKEEEVNNTNETDESIPKSKRKYLNPANGKLVGYQRARKLGLV